MQSKSPDAVILDLGLPDIDVSKIREQIRLLSKVPIIILTSRRGGIDTIKGLELGADEYMVKPFEQRELIAQVKQRCKGGMLIK